MKQIMQRLAHLKYIGTKCVGCRLRGRSSVTSDAFEAGSKEADIVQNNGVLFFMYNDVHCE